MSVPTYAIGAMLGIATLAGLYLFLLPLFLPTWLVVAISIVHIGGGYGYQVYKWREFLSSVQNRS